MTEAAETFPCFGTTCAALVMGDGPGGTAAQAVTAARTRLLGWHERFTRFEPASELSRLNGDPRTEVALSGDMARFVAAALEAAEHTDGLVDATLLREIETAGYRTDLGEALALPVALADAPARRAAAPHPAERWRAVRLHGTTVERPPGLALDTGGLAKGLCADLLAAGLEEHASYALDCGGDLRLGGAAGLAREVNVASPFDGSTLHTFLLSAGGVATSGIGRRAWRGADGAPAHHLLDPATGRPAYTGIVQATALAPTALEAEVRAKAAVLSGPERAAEWLPDGGLLVFDDGEHAVLEAS